MDMGEKGRDSEEMLTTRADKYAGGCRSSVLGLVCRESRWDWPIDYPQHKQTAFSGFGITD